MNKNVKMSLLGAVTGIANGFFGSGGGIVAVPLLKKSGFKAKEAHACSLALTLPLSAASAVLYLHENAFDIGKALVLLPFGLAGALTGAFLIKRLSAAQLSGVFGVLLVISGIRSFFS